jgi:hypothetical protein
MTNSKAYIYIGKLLIILVFTTLLTFPNLTQAQDKGVLASLLNQSCRYYSDLDFRHDNILNDKGEGYAAYCWGFFEALIEVHQNERGNDIFSCVPTYAYYDVFLENVIKNFMSSYAKTHADDNKLKVRAYSLVNTAITKEYDLLCGAPK